MEFPTSRRVGTTYGRNTKKALVHDLFDYRSGTYGNAVNVEPSAVLSSSPAAEQIVRPAHSTTEQTTKKRPSPKPLTLLRSPSPFGRAELESRAIKAGPSLQGSDPFEMDSDSSGPSTIDQKPQQVASKRRKLTRGGQPAKPHEIEHPPTRTMEASKSVATARSQDVTISQPRNSSARTGPERSEPKTRPVARSKLSRTDPSERLMRPGKASPPVPAKQKSTPRKRLPNIQTSKITNDDTMSMDEPTGTDVSDHLTDASDRSATLTHTPRRRTLTPQSGESLLSSPGQLGLSSLQLTQPKNPDSETHVRSQTASDVSDVSDTPKPLRSRLVDRLDAPQTSISLSSPDQNANAEAQRLPASLQTVVTARGRQQARSPTTSAQFAPASGPERSQSSQARATYATKARTTYAKERSHLSDMADNLHILPASSNQSSQHSLLKTAASNLASKLEMEDDDSDDQGTTKLKSIHELRQAGVNNRFDRELQAVFEDMEAEGSSTKSMRIRASMKLFDRLRDESFMRQFLNSGRINRLARCTTQSRDLLSAALLLMNFWLISKATGDFDTSNLIFRAVAELAPKLLKESRALLDVARDRKQNLSKSTLKELIAFEAQVIQSGVMASLQCDHVYSDMLALTCMDGTLRNMLQVKHDLATMSAQSYSSILKLLETHAARYSDGLHADSGTTTVRCALSLLEVCSTAFGSIESEIPESEFQTLGNSLSKLMTSTLTNQEDVQQHILRVVVSLSNNKPQTCHLLGQTPIVDAVFAVVDTSFLDLARSAELEQPLDQKRLDAVILALGCLLNFAECDSDMRVHLSVNRLGGRTYTERLVDMFNTQVAKVQEAMTEEQSQVLVAFGYLSMLLCTVSLEPSVRLQVTQSLKNQSFLELCAAAKTFFSHLRTLQNISDDAAMSNFTARFGAILDTIQRPLV